MPVPFLHQCAQMLLQIDSLVRSRVQIDAIEEHEQGGGGVRREDVRLQVSDMHDESGIQIGNTDKDTVSRLHKRIDASYNVIVQATVLRGIGLVGGLAA